MSRGRKEQRHACSVIGTQQYGRMESNSANAPLANGSVGVETAGKTGERETNAPNSFEAPQAAEERETNTPCQRETAENTGTRETNVSEKETATARGDGRPPTIAEQRRGRESRRPPSTQRLASCPTRLMKGQPSWTPRKQQAWTLVMGRRLESIGPTQPMLSEPEHQRARQAGAGRPAAADARDVS